MLDIGNLVQISQTFLESFVTLKGLLTDLFKKGGGSATDTDKIMVDLRDKVNAFQSRLQGLANPSLKPTDYRAAIWTLRLAK